MFLNNIIDEVELAAIFNVTTRKNPTFHTGNMTGSMHKYSRYQTMNIKLNSELVSLNYCFWPKLLVFLLHLPVVIEL